jgi:Peptidase family M28
VLLILAGAVWLGLVAAEPPRRLPTTAAADHFSADRAMRDLDVIARAPHPVGSPDHARVRDYLVTRLRQLGCDTVRVQHATGFNTLGNTPIAAVIDNVICVKWGTHPGRSVLLMAHYDAVPRSYGAADDGSGVAAILETLRALQHGPPLANDVIAVFSDAEEQGLLGAEAFVDLDPSARNVGVVLNADARGVSGPVYMFQTTPGNTPLISTLAAQVPDAYASSLTGDIYRHLPNDTDLSIWLHSRWTGGAMNFAFIGGLSHYHTPRDNLASLDHRSLQHLGNYLLPLTRAFGNADLTAPRTADAEYFDAPLVGVIHYPETWALPIALIEVVGVLVLLAAAVGRNALTWRGVGLGAAVAAGAFTLPAGFTWVVWRGIMALHPAYAEMTQRNPYHAALYLAAFTALSATLVVALQRLAMRRAKALELAVVPYLLWTAAAVACAIELPGGSFLLEWPLAAALLGGMAVLLEWPAPVVALSALPALTLFAPLVSALATGLTAAFFPECMLLVALALLLVVIPIQLADSAWRRVLPAGAALGLVCLVAAEVLSGFNASHPRPDSLLYLVNADSGTAWWATWDRHPDGWTRHALGPEPRAIAFARFQLTFGADSLLATSAPVDTTDDVDVRVVSSEFLPDGRRIHLNITAPVSVDRVTFAFAGDSFPLRDLVINGRPIRPGIGDKYQPRYHRGSRGRLLTFFGIPPGGIDLRFTVPSVERVPLLVVAALDGFPGVIGVPAPRPPSFMSKPFVMTDERVVSETVWM